jgi:hypothetical protein
MALAAAGREVNDNERLIPTKLGMDLGGTIDRRVGSCMARAALVAIAAANAACALSCVVMVATESGMDDVGWIAAGVEATIAGVAEKKGEL